MGRYPRIPCSNVLDVEHFHRGRRPRREGTNTGSLCVFDTRCFAVILLGNHRTPSPKRFFPPSSSSVVSRVLRDGRQDDSISHRLQDKEDQPHHRILPSPFLLRRLCIDPFDSVSPLILSSFPVVGHLATLSVTRSSDPMPSIISATILISTRANKI